MIDSDIELVIFDADGTLRYVTVPGQHYPIRSHEWRLMPWVQTTMAALPASRLEFGIASNQHGVALGQLTRAEAEAMLVATWHAAFGFCVPPVSIELCTCLPNAACARRKPGPGMLQSLMARHQVRPEQVLYVGDLAIDQQAAASAHVRFIWAQDFFVPPANLPSALP
jgi:D-glycero-D-manno-heptose 1,7-bisphosphate phosphatase